MGQLRLPRHEYVRLRRTLRLKKLLQPEKEKLNLSHIFRLITYFNLRETLFLERRTLINVQGYTNVCVS